MKLIFKIDDTLQIVNKSVTSNAKIKSDNWGDEFKQIKDLK